MSRRLLAAMTGALAQLPPMTLDEVLAEAELQTRVDRKYLVPIGTFVGTSPSARPSNSCMKLSFVSVQPLML